MQRRDFLRLSAAAALTARAHAATGPRTRRIAPAPDPQPDFQVLFSAEFEPAAAAGSLLAAAGWAAFAARLQTAGDQGLRLTALTGLPGFGSTWYFAGLEPGSGAFSATSVPNREDFLALMTNHPGTLVDFTAQPTAAGGFEFCGYWRTDLPPQTQRLQWFDTYQDLVQGWKTSANVDHLVLSRLAPLSVNGQTGFLALFAAISGTGSTLAIAGRKDLPAMAAKYLPGLAPVGLAYATDGITAVITYLKPAANAAFATAQTWSELDARLEHGPFPGRLRALAAYTPLPPLFRPPAPSAADVMQGELGDCYLMASLAALAAANPASIANAISMTGAGRYRVVFTDGVTEPVSDDDLAFSRDNGFDLSPALWPGVMIRAYGQRMLRGALAQALSSPTENALLRASTHALVSSDIVVLAYDRAIRASVSQSGDLTADTMAESLRQQLQPLPLPATAKSWLLDQVRDRGVLAALAAVVQNNGNCFGAYKSIGHGGNPGWALSAWAGEAHGYPCNSSAAVAALLAPAFAARRAVVASSRPGAVISADARATWYVEGHAYTVLAFDAAAASVRIRNPWGHHPDPNGEATLSLPDFLAGFDAILVSGAQIQA